jgi:hypothetical protein
MELKDEKETEVLDFTRPTYTFKANEVHDWRQQGPYLVCKGPCDLQHAVFIGMGKILVGLDEKGMPILKTR